LVDELRQLRRGRGIHATRPPSGISPTLRRVCGIDDDDSTAAVTRKLMLGLRREAERLPPDLRAAVIAGLALDGPETGLLLQRMDALADEVNRDSRTVRRRVDEGLRVLGELIEGERAGAADSGIGLDWYVEECETVVRLDRAGPEAFERRKIRTHSGVDHLDLFFTLPRVSDGAHDLEVDVVYGGRLALKEHETPSRFRMTLELASALEPGQDHEYAVIYRIPPGQRMAPRYVYTPKQRCDAFSLRVRFDTERPPDSVWRISEAFHRDVDDAVPGPDNLITPDRFGEVRVQFAGLLPGHGYGVAWSPTK
jgi:hypothetical protein